MANSRKDRRGYVLHKGEYERSDGLYMYVFIDKNHQKRCVYAKTLPLLRAKEKQMLVEQELGTDPFLSRRITLNQAYDRYMHQKVGLKISTKNNYLYMYDQYVRDTFGKKVLATIRYSDIKTFFMQLHKKRGLKVRTIESVYTQIHPALQLAVREGIIRSNPADGLMRELKSSVYWDRSPRKALTIPQQKAFMEYVKNDPAFTGMAPLYTVLLGTGMRIGECLGLTWNDIDFEGGFITVDKTLIYRKDETGKFRFMITKPKTTAGIRTIPLFQEVRDAFLDEYQIQSIVGFSKASIDGVSGFVFHSSTGKPILTSAINRSIKSIVKNMNDEEIERAKRERREPFLMPDFSAHSLRHTFCTRLCETENNMKVIQAIMGHSDITTTMDIYAEVTNDKKREVACNLEGKITIL